MKYGEASVEFFCGHLRFRTGVVVTYIKRKTWTKT